MPTLKELYTKKAYVRMGIAATDWKPALGYRYNREIMDQLYYYYQQVYLLKPEAFYWMGLARLTGGQVLWGMDHLVAIVKDPCVLTQKIVEAAKDIFENLAWQHELFLDDPQQLIQAVMLQDCTKKETYLYQQCWQLIWHNTDESIAEGNGMLLYNEQYNSIQPHYNAIKMDTYSKKYFWFTRFIMRCIHPYHHRFILDQPWKDVTDFAPRWQWISHDKGMWKTWVATPISEKIRLIQLPNEAIMAHRWVKAI